MTTRTDNIGRASMWLASGTIISRVLGFVKVAVLAQTIGAASVGINAFTLANSLPNQLYMIIAGGVLNAVLVPQIVRATKQGDGGLGYINKLVTLAIVVLGVTTLLTTLLAPWIVSIYAVSSVTGSSASGDAILALAIAFGYWCMPQILFYGLYTVLGEILNARRMFGPFTWAPILNNVVAIGGLVLFTVMFGADPEGTLTAGAWDAGKIAVLAGSATLGVIAQAGILMVFWRRVGLKFRFDFQWRGVGLKAAGKASSWAFGIMIAGQLAYLVTNNVAWIAADSGFPSVFVLNMAWLVFVLPHSIITVSITTAHFTRMSEHAAAGDLAAVRRDFSEMARSVFLLITLIMCGIIVLAIPVSRLFANTDAQVMPMALVLVGHMVWLLFFTFIFLVQRTFYALGDTRKPFLFFVLQYGLQSILCVVVALTITDQFIAFGISIAQGLAMAITMPVALMWLKRVLTVGLDGARITRSIVLFTIAGVVSSLAGYLVTRWLGGNSEGGWGNSSVLGALVTMAIVGAVMSVIYLGMLVVMRSADLQAVLNPVMRRLRR
ncbi:murein biosynthesis integral membrane protein MurJ [Klugiella xanthotipulae]|uniref:Putative peptidoglycan lipid II flippase n=1 Tax=Klugiella xanthotipulae TaxID=244735 RepID=A0A543I6R9_9MICO|nr:lipid II flippase MurJ [Klugiella xanthotipulae]TQM66302.1 putative peptidoglycan lipid II flippase [Klugiella xanthotipulae]